MTTPRRSNGATKPAPAIVRCAIYTRKSTDEGLDRDFNSLDNQREAAENYIQSQRGQGWEILPDRYDDGGFSGGTTDRPALKRLLADVEAGKIECVVVYKYDRLSRSMLDFLQMLRFFEQQGVAFVSVTQQFNTATPVGRMTMNVLASFGEFERDIISERTRDKMHAARRRGKWTGGSLVLGYDCDPKGGRLVLNETEAERVREIFRLFIENPSPVGLSQELNGRGWTLKSWTTREGRVVGGGSFDKFSLRRLLTNHAYVGKVNFHGVVYDAEHAPIVDQETWGRVQELLARNQREQMPRGKPGSALLRGILYCAPCGAAMSPTFSQKRRLRYRYYLCLKAHRRGWSTCPSKSVPAVEIERFVVDRLRAMGNDPELVATTIEEAGKQMAARRTRREVRKALRIDPEELSAALKEFDSLWEQLSSEEQARIVHLLIQRVDYDGSNGSLVFSFRPEAARLLAAEQATVSEATA